MGLYPGVTGVVVVASGSVSASGGGWVVLVLGACCSPVIAVSVRVSSTGGVGEGWGGDVRDSGCREEGWG